MPDHSRTTPPSPPNLDRAALRATPAGTERYRKRFEAGFVDDFFRTTTAGITVSSIGIGTYLGDSNDSDDAAYQSAIRQAIGDGVNLVDTAINYRSQRSERTVGAAIQQAIAAGEVSRDELVVCSKGGYIPLDGAPPATREAYQAYVRREFIDREILRPSEIFAGGHSLAP